MVASRYHDLRRALLQFFDLFFSDGDTNLGLGLAQVRDMARRAGGFATIESTPGVGTTVTVGLPVVDEGER